MNEQPRHIDSERCWCGPEVLQECPICLGVGTHAADLDCELPPPCPQCQGRGSVPAYNEHEAKVIVHRRI